MKKVLLTVFATSCIFAAGVFAGMWIQRTQPLPAPPIGFLGEIRDVPLSSSNSSRNYSQSTDALPRLAADMEKLKPDILAFKNKLEPIKTEFREQLDALLTEDQRARLKVLNEQVASTTVPDAGGSSAKKPHDGLDSLLPIVIVPSTLERLSAELRLDEGQKAGVQALLLKRRARFLDLVDTTPPPSLQLRRIAPLIPQIAQPSSK
jgi:hypothetical protein